MISANHEGVQRVRVLSLPGRHYAQNSYFPLLWNALEATGVEMISARTMAALMLRYDILQVHIPEHLVTERSLYYALP